MKEIDFENFVHVGIVVKSIDATLESLRQIYRINECRINAFPPEDDDVQLMYHGSKAKFSARFCFMKIGETEVELIEPVKGDSVWTDFLNEKGEGLHHLKFEVESINETINDFKRLGYPCTQYGSAVGPNLGKTWAYFDTTGAFGYYTEVLNRQIGEVVSEI